LAGDISEDPKYPKTQFPPAELCRDCFDESTSRWREDRVYSFLLSHYGRSNIKTASSRSLASAVVQRDKPKVDGAPPSSKNVSSSSSSSSKLLFTVVDFTICSAMYVASFAVLVFVYFYFVASKRHRRSHEALLLPMRTKKYAI
jgi:hypothetical protein